MSKKPVTKKLLSDVRQLIEDARNRVAVTVNSEMTMLYWRVGKRINDEVLLNKRAEYGKEIINLLSLDLTLQFETGWGVKYLRHCLVFATSFQDDQIVYTLCRQFKITPTKNKITIPQKNPFNFAHELQVAFPKCTIS